MKVRKIKTDGEQFHLFAQFCLKNKKKTSFPAGNAVYLYLSAEGKLPFVISTKLLTLLTRVPRYKIVLYIIYENTFINKTLTLRYAENISIKLERKFFSLSLTHCRCP